MSDVQVSKTHGLPMPAGHRLQIHHDPHFKGTHGGRPFHGMTSCHLVNLDGRVLESGYAWCHPNDNYCRAKGRKVAFAQLLEDLKLDRAERGHYWAYFHATCKV